jgi:hypothetical protein
MTAHSFQFTPGGIVSLDGGDVQVPELAPAAIPERAPRVVSERGNQAKVQVLNGRQIAKLARDRVRAIDKLLANVPKLQSERAELVAILAVTAAPRKTEGIQ